MNRTFKPEREKIQILITWKLLSRSWPSISYTELVFSLFSLFKGPFIATQLNSTQLDVELRWVELCRYKLAFSLYCFLQRNAMQAQPMSSCGVCLSVCVSVYLSCSWILSKRINIASNFFHHRVATPFWFFRTKRHGDIPTGTPLTGASNAGGVGRNRDSDPISGFNACS